MPVVIDAAQKKKTTKSRTYIGRRRGRFDELDLDQQQTSFVCYRVLQNINNEVSDIHVDEDKVWVEEFTGTPPTLKTAGLSPRIFLKSDFHENGMTEIQDDLGMIIRYHGTCAGKRGVNSQGDIITMEEAEERQELTGEESEAYNLWEFRIANVIITDGPELKERALDTADEQRKGSESKMMEAITKAFSAIGAQQEGPLNINTMAQSGPEAQESLAQKLSAMSDTERYALMDEAENKKDQKNIVNDIAQNKERLKSVSREASKLVSENVDDASNREVKRQGSFSGAIKTRLPSPTKE